MSRTARRQHHDRLGALALVAVSLLVAAAQQPLSAAEKTRRVNASPIPVAPPAPAPAASPPAGGAPDAAGYWIVGVDGGIYAYGAAPFKGSTGAIKLNKPIVGLAATPSGQGYWLVASDGGIFSFGDASFRGSTGAMVLNKPIVGMASTPSGKGYWLVASDGGIFAFGDAAFRGSTGAIKLNKPIVGMAPTRSGQGYWLVASDGGIFAFGDATFAGSTGHLKLVRPITGMAAAPSGRGYWMTASDGGVFSFGDARFFGAARDRIATPESGRGVVGIVPTRSGAGYWQVAASGKIFAFGDAPGDLGAPTGARSTIVGMAANPAGAGTIPAPTAIKPLGVPSGPAPQMFRSASKPTWGTSPSKVERDKAGRALAVVEAGNWVFIGGEFDGLVPPSPNQKGYAAAPVTARPYLAALDVTSGAPANWDVHPDDAVLALAVSADRRTLYAGGRFRNIAGGPATHLAAINIETGALDPTFQPPALDDPVKAMVLFGDTLYIAGEFRHVGGAERPQLAALDARTGALRDGFVPPENGGGYFQGQSGREVESGHDGAVHDLAITSDGRYLVAGGDFLDFGDRGGLLVVDGATGRPTAWQPTIDRPVHGLTMWPGDNRTFFVATGGTGGQVQAFRILDSLPAVVVDIDNDDDDDDDDDDDGRRSRRSRRSGDSDDFESEATEPLWVHKTDGDAEDVVATTERVYLVGHYDYVLGDNTVCGSSSCEGGRDGDVVNRHISVFEPIGGAHDVSFTAQLNTPQGPYAAHIGARHLYVVGDFTECNGAPQPGFVAFPTV
ncbi:MAG TPA: hypothetical protein VFW57_02305 [Acidimicrobiia bacterium]|nr:hypothetical protein [Acidimicrobiia bacterium]